MYDRVRLLLRSRGSSFAALARSLEVERPRVAALLRSGRLAEATLVRLEAALGVSRDWWSEPLPEAPPVRSRAWEVVQGAVLEALAPVQAERRTGKGRASTRGRVSARAGKRPA
jgi:transcriptional regulator with XRE-family HTH domain